MIIIILLVLCCVCGSHGDQDRKDVLFNISKIDGWALCTTIPKEVVAKEGQTVRLYADIRIPKHDEIHRASCKYNNGTKNYTLGDEYFKENAKSPWVLDVANVKKDMFGEWRCNLGFNKFNTHDLKPFAGDYTFINCVVRVKGQDDGKIEKPEPTTKPHTMDSQTIYIIVGVGSLVLIVIIAQTIALCYFKRKAQPRRRMDKMASRARFDRGDQARYSAPPCRKNSKGNARAQADTDSHIYEMVGVNALYKESSELNQEVKSDTDGKSIKIKDRPPLPLPHEIPDSEPLNTLPRKPSPLKSMPSSLSLISSGSSTLSKRKKEQPPLPGQGFKKAPPRPPKQIDEDSLPGSLKRPPKAMPSLALVPKTGSMPKMAANDPAVMELKNIFKKRNVGNVSDSPAPSPSTTLERKPPIQAKPNKKQLKQEEEAIAIPPQKPTGGVNPLGTNQMRLILPKIEASLKSPQKPIPTPQNPVKPTTVPLKKPMSHSTPMSQPAPTSQPIPTSKPMSHPTLKPTLQTRPLPPVSHLAASQPVHVAHMSPLQSRPSNPMSKPIPMSHPTLKPTLQTRPPPPVSHLAPSQPAPVAHMSPLQSRPLPTPHEGPIPRPHEVPMPRPLPPDPMPPIYQEADEDGTPDTDDEEWTYEHLEQFNIYNM